MLMKFVEVILLALRDRVDHHDGPFTITWIVREYITSVLTLWTLFCSSSSYSKSLFIPSA